MIAKGRDASELFPAVVKNVVSKNIEVKKLVYVYLVRYAEQQQDLALLSISTFQRALKVKYLKLKTFINLLICVYIFLFLGPKSINTSICFKSIIKYKSCNDCSNCNVSHKRFSS